jgi:two-component system chemotaxis sensor kinase CheA
MSSPSAAVAPELNEIALRLGELAAGDVDALGLLRPALNRVVVDPQFKGEVKSLLVQALLLLDDPRVRDRTSGTTLMLKIRKLVAAALAADAAGSVAPAPQSSAGQPRFSPDALLSAEVDHALLDEFVVEAREQLETAEAALLVLDSDPQDVQALETLFRALHTIKGTSAFLGIEPATELAHHAETLLTRVRSGAASCTGELSNLIFRAIDHLGVMLVSIEQMMPGDVLMVPSGYRDLVTALREGPSHDTPTPRSRRSTGQFRRLLSGDLSVRIRAGDLDRLAGVVQELVLAQAMLTRDASMRGNPELARKATFAERLALELEDLTTELRTVPFATPLQKLARLARDAAYQSGKTIELELAGDDVLIERVMADALSDPLMHMVRNAIDHGIEPSTERAAAGKAEAGVLRIAARRHGTELVIELSDDGRGIDPQRIARVAKERGLITADEHLTEADAFELLFRPGFTTASVVTDLSGRGVGMDVVRTNIDAAGGTIEVASRLGHGTTFTIRLPFRTQNAPSSERGVNTAWLDSERSIGLIA